MPREPEIQPGQAFHLPAAQNKNIDNLLKIFGKKEATDALTELGKMDKNTWKDVKDTVIGLKDFVVGGGISTIKEEIRQVLNEEVTGIMSPLLNEFQPLFSLFYDAIEPILPLIQDVVTWIVNVLKPVIQWIADTLRAIIEFLTSGETAATLLPRLFQDLVDFLTDEPGGTTVGAYGERTGERIGGGGGLVEGLYGDY